MLELEVVPEHGLCSDQIELLLGMHFSSAVAAIQSLVGSIKGVQILYSDKEPLKIDLVINLTLDGIKLIFDPINQRLKTIEVHDLTCLKLKYCDVVFNCPEVSPTIEQIDQSFGATHPGVYDEDKHVFTLTFRGLSFEFPAETQFQPRYGGIRQELGRLQFPPGESPRVSRMYIYCGSSLSDCFAPPPPSPRFPCVRHHSVDVLRRQRQTLGLRVRISPTPRGLQHSDSSDCSTTRNLDPDDLGDLGDHHGRTGLIPHDAEESGAVPKDVLFGDSVQDVVSAIGAPARIFYKDEDKMKIHSPNAHRKAAAQKSDYFYNYFTLGFDVLFDARTNCIKKFVLHTNYPGHYNFNMYHRCMFDLPLHPGGSGGSGSPSPTSISPFSRWDEIAEKVKPCERPVVLNRSSSTNTTNPFGSTFCYGYQDIIFEVMPNFHIASVTLYSQSVNQNLRHHKLSGSSSSSSYGDFASSSSNVILSSQERNYVVASSPSSLGRVRLASESSSCGGGGGSGGAKNAKGKSSYREDAFPDFGEEMSLDKDFS